MPRGADRKPPSSASARLAAFRLLGEVLERHRPLDEALARMLAPAGLLGRAEAREKGFARLLVMTVLRRLGQIDDVLARMIPRPLPKQAAAARNALRLGVAQLLFLATPAHAAVAATVGLLPSTVPQRGLANAVLRRVAREGADLLRGQDAAALNLPDWMRKRWIEAYGAEAVAAAVAAQMTEPPLDLTLRDPASAPDWAARLGAEILPTGGLRLAASGQIEDLPGYAEGAWWVQDAAATLPVRLLMPRAGERIADLCAAPGGKTAQLAAAGAKVVAVDRDSARLARVRDNLARLKLAAECRAVAVEDLRPEPAFDAVLLDAPCTASGTVRRHPDIPWLRGPADIAALAAIQERLLAAAATMVRPGGRLVYCVCSLEPEEGPRRIAAFLQSEAGRAFRRHPVAAAELPGLAEAIGPDGDLRTMPGMWPDRGGLDGFYAARLNRGT